MIDGNYQGLGISVQMDDGAVKVVSPFKGSPADKAGIKAGDFITHIDGKLIYGLELDDAVKQMRGPPAARSSCRSSAPAARSRSTSA
jgi:carboxyl-terminal processing protease